MDLLVSASGCFSRLSCRAVAIRRPPHVTVPSTHSLGRPCQGGPAPSQPRLAQRAQPYASPTHAEAHCGALSTSEEPPLERGITYTGMLAHRSFLMTVQGNTPRAQGDRNAPHLSPVTPDEDVRTILINRVSWGAVLAGVAVALAVQLILNLLGIGLGAATFDPAGSNNPS